MNSLLVLIPISLLLLCVAIGAFVWAVNHEQFDDLESPAVRILFDDDLPDAQRGDAPSSAPCEHDSEDGDE